MLKLSGKHTYSSSSDLHISKKYDKPKPLPKTTRKYDLKIRVLTIAICQNSQMFYKVGVLWKTQASIFIKIRLKHKHFLWIVQNC